MESQQRKAVRTDVDVFITLKQIGGAFGRESGDRQVPVNVVNISRGGIAFKTTEKLQVGIFYDTIVKLANNESFGTVIRIVWMQDNGDSEFVYGCRFVGISSESEFKIDCYQIVDEYGKLYSQQTK